MPAFKRNPKIIMGSSFFDAGKQLAVMGHMLEDHQARLNIILFDKDKIPPTADEIHKRVSGLRELQARFRDLCKNAVNTEPYLALNAKFEKLFEQYNALTPRKTV